MKGAHHGRDADHEHARCRFCGRPDVHVTPTHNGGSVAYAPHTVPGDDTVTCQRSQRSPRSRTVWPEDRHQQIPDDDEETP